MQNQDANNDFISTFEEFISERINNSDAIQKHPDYNSAIRETEEITRQLKQKLPDGLFPLLNNLEDAYLSLIGTVCHLSYRLGLRDGARLNKMLAE